MSLSEEAANAADLFEIIRTTRSMRRLKPDAVPNELIRKILEAGVCAPSGGNMQRWRFLVIKDAGIKQTVGAYYKRAWDEQVAPRYRAGDPAPGMSRERFLRLLDAAEYLAAHIHEAPVWIVPCVEAARRPARPVRRSSGGPGYTARGAGARPGRDVDDAVPEFREAGRGGARSPGGLAFICLDTDRLSDG